MGWLVEGVQGQPTARLLERRAQVTGGDLGLHQLLEGARQSLAQIVRGLHLPIVKFGAVAEPEACHEVVPIQPDRTVQRSRITASEEALKVPDVDPDRF